MSKSQFMTLNELLNAEPTKDDVERAYRRGVHQAFAMLDWFLEDTDFPISRVLPKAIRISSNIRGSNESYPILLHSLFQKIEDELLNKPQPSLTFLQWLKKQTKRDDPIGDFARDVKMDNRRKPKNRKGWRKFLSNINACDGAKRALEEAWNEYESAA